MSLVDLVFPKTCLECGMSGGYVCLNCLAKVKTPRPVCPICLRPSLYGKTHRICNNKQGLDGLTCLWKYEGVVRKAILRLKYNFALDISKELVKEASQKLQKERPIFLKDAILVPIPLFWYRKNWRGFNQTEEVGRGIAQSLSCKFLPNLLTRRKFNSPQTGLSRAGRQRNITGIFDISLSSTPPLDGAKIILFDDVWTTGSTLREASRVLKRKGVGAVWGLTLAR